MEHSNSDVQYLCWSAYVADKLKGDLNFTQIVAKQIAQVEERLIQQRPLNMLFKTVNSRLDNQLETWLALEYPEAYNAIKAEREADELAEKEAHEAPIVTGDNLDEIRRKLDELDNYGR